MKKYLLRLINKQIRKSYIIACGYNSGGNYVSAFSTIWRLKICHFKLSILNRMLGRNYTPMMYGLTKGSEFDKVMNYKKSYD